MSDFTIIGIIGEILQELLRKGLNETFSASFTERETISLLSPKDLEGTSTDKLSFFLYQIIENAYMKNQPMKQVNVKELRYPSLCLNLYYLLTPYAGSERDRIPGWDSHTILGRSMQILFDNASLEGPPLMRILENIGQEDYYDGIQQIRIILNPVSLDDMTKIWNSLDTAMKLSVCYEVRVMMIESERIKETSRVIEKNTDYYQIKGR